jgi:hypothetical protein
VFFCYSGQNTFNSKIIPLQILLIPPLRYEYLSFGPGYIYSPKWFNLPERSWPGLSQRYRSENLSRFVPQFVVILKQLFADIQTEKNKRIADHL